MPEPLIKKLSVNITNTDPINICVLSKDPPAVFLSSTFLIFISWGWGFSGRTLAWQARGPGFSPRHHPTPWNSSHLIAGRLKLWPAMLTNSLVWFSFLSTRVCCTGAQPNFFPQDMTWIKIQICLKHLQNQQFSLQKYSPWMSPSPWKRKKYKNFLLILILISSTQNSYTWGAAI